VRRCRLRAGNRLSASKQDSRHALKSRRKCVTLIQAGPALEILSISGRSLIRCEDLWQMSKLSMANCRPAGDNIARFLIRA